MDKRMIKILEQERDGWRELADTLHTEKATLYATTLSQSEDLELLIPLANNLQTAVDVLKCVHDDGVEKASKKWDIMGVMADAVLLLDRYYTRKKVKDGG